MREQFYSGDLGVTIDLLCDKESKTAIITRVETTRRLRGKGHASKMMREVLEEADIHGVTLLLAVEPDGTGLPKEDLINWYLRLGFEHHPSELIMIRNPQS